MCDSDQANDMKYFGGGTEFYIDLDKAILPEAFPDALTDSGAASKRMKVCLYHGEVIGVMQTERFVYTHKLERIR